MTESHVTAKFLLRPQLLSKMVDFSGLEFSALKSALKLLPPSDSENDSLGLHIKMPAYEVPTVITLSEIMHDNGLRHEVSLS